MKGKGESKRIIRARVGFIFLTKLALSHFYIVVDSHDQVLEP